LLPRWYRFAGAEEVDMREASVVLGVVSCVAGCTFGDDDKPESADVPTTVIHVSESGTCDGTCELLVGLDWCSGYVPLVLPDTREAVVQTDLAVDDVAGIAQVQYDAIATDVEGAHADYVMGAGQRAEIHSLYGPTYDSGWLFYRLDAAGGVTDIDTRHLVQASGNTLVFEYAGVREEHVIGAPQVVSVETQECVDCSAGRPVDLGVVVALVLIPWRRRRKLRG
jgi:hypothetical protein